MATGTNSTDGDLAKARSRAPLEPDAPVRTFLIADVRGYTRFTQEHGDEEAGRLAAAFAALAREAVLSSGGEVIELRGDEALCVFGSARQALRAAVELQRRFRRRADGGPAFPLPIGIGLDAGEAVSIEGGYRGGALNTAARLCSLAGPGQILATDTVASLARQLEGIRFLDRRPVRVKGLEKPVRVIEVVPEQELPPVPAVAAPPPRLHRRPVIIAAIAGLGLAAAAGVFLVNRALEQDFLARVDANSVGVIDADAAGITRQLSLGSTPTAITAGGGFLWVASERDRTVSRIDPETRAVQTLSLDESAADVAYGAGSLWVTEPDERTVIRVNPDTLAVVKAIPVGNGPASVAAGIGALWVANTIDGTVSRIDLRRGIVTRTIPVAARPAGIAVGAGSVWVTSEEAGTVLRVDPRSGRTLRGIPVGNGPTGIAVSEQDVWVANRPDGTVSRIDPSTNSVTATIPVGASPAAVAVGDGAAWVASEGDGTIGASTRARDASTRRSPWKAAPLIWRSTTGTSG